MELGIQQSLETTYKKLLEAQARYKINYNKRLRRENHNQTERLRILLAMNTVTCSASRLH